MCAGDTAGGGGGGYTVSNGFGKAVIGFGGTIFVFGIGTNFGGLKC